MLLSRRLLENVSSIDEYISSKSDSAMLVKASGRNIRVFDDCDNLLQLSTRNSRYVVSSI